MGMPDTPIGQDHCFRFALSPAVAVNSQQRSEIMTRLGGDCRTGT